MPTQITKWKAADGELFDSEELAQKHELLCLVNADFYSWWSHTEAEFCDHDQSITAEAVIDFLMSPKGKDIVYRLHLMHSPMHQPSTVNMLYAPGTK